MLSETIKAVSIVLENKRDKKIPQTLYAYGIFYEYDCKPLFQKYHLFA